MAAVLLASAILVGLIFTVQGPDEKRNALAASVASVLHVTQTLVFVLGATTSAAATVDFAATGQRSLLDRAEQAWDAGNERIGKTLGRIAFEEHGLRIATRDATGSVHVFEPTTDDFARRRRHRDVKDETARLHATLERNASDFGWAALVYLASLGATLVLGPWVVVLARRPRAV